MFALAGCSSDPGTNEVIVHLEFERGLPADGQATVQLVPRQPSAALPVFSARQPVAAGATSVQVSVGYDLQRVGGVDYRLSARVDAQSVLLLGSAERDPELDADGDRLSIDVAAP